MLKIINYKQSAGSKLDANIALPSHYNQFKMSTTKTVTLSIQSLNKLYFQFFDKFVIPNLVRSVNEITSLLRNKTAYQVYKYLEEVAPKSQSSDSYSLSLTVGALGNSTGGLANSLGSYNSNGNNLYQYALASSAQVKGHTFEKSGVKSIQQGMSFKNKLGMKRAMTGLAYEDVPKPIQYKNYSDDTFNPSIYTQALPEFKIDFATPVSKDNLPNVPTLPLNIGRLESIQQQDNRKTMKDIVRRVSKIFNDNHSKIEKYNKNTNESNKIFNINTSTRLQKKDSSKQYQFYMKPDQHGRKF